MNSLSTALKESILSALTPGRKQRADVSAEQLSGLKQSMLAYLAPTGDARPARLACRITFMQDIDGLWFARPELFHQLCRTHDQAHATRCLEELDDRFAQLMPRGRRQAPRRSPHASALRG